LKFDNLLKNPSYHSTDGRDTVGKLIAIIGNTGIGKTSLVQALAKQGNYGLGIEQHLERPFQVLFKENPQFAFPNQIDFLLFRAEQENQLRKIHQISLIDGGLDLDFQGFTRLFHARGYLNDPEFDLCQRIYDLTRSLLPLPDLIIHLTSSMEIIKQRLAMRNRINIARDEDLQLLNGFIENWLRHVDPEIIIRLDVSTASVSFSEILPILIRKINTKLQLDAGTYDTGYIP
jgi:deoxyadenosine/deoxycytidine kinase